MQLKILNQRLVYNGYITELEPNQIFVYGANPQGIHGSGTARIALDKYGAVMYQPKFNGRSYGIITKNLIPGFVFEGKEYTLAGMRSISESDMRKNIREFYAFAEDHPELDFLVAYTANGSNLNGYTASEMAKLFATASSFVPDNVMFEDEFSKLL